MLDFDGCRLHRTRLVRLHSAFRQGRNPSDEMNVKRRRTLVLAIRFGRYHTCPEFDSHLNAAGILFGPFVVR